MRIPLLNLFKRYTQKVGQPPGTLVYLGEEPTEPVRITIIDYDETYLEEEEVQTVQACVPFIDTETITWIQIEGIHEIPIIEEIGKCFGVDPLLLEDLMSPTQLPKIETSEHYREMALHIFVNVARYTVVMSCFERKENSDVFKPRTGIRISTRW